MLADASTMRTPVGCDATNAMDADNDASTIVTADADAETPIDAETAPCVVSGSPYNPELKTPELYVERKAISLP
jgi:hypothetical protein